MLVFVFSYSDGGGDQCVFCRILNSRAQLSVSFGGFVNVADILTFEFFFLRWISLFVRKTLSQYSALTSGSDVGGRHFCPLGPTLEPLLNHKFLSMQPNYRCKQVFCMAISDWVEMSKSPTNSWFNMHG